jgi:predicted lipoprotein with Yx(FWY)xxD motif
MRRNRFSLLSVVVLVAAIVAVVVATSGASTTKAQRTAASATSAISVNQTSLGSTLVDGKGRTLYLFEGDRPNVSTLSAAGQAVWPPFTASTKPQALNGAVAARIGTIPAAGGQFQITYNGHPLYYYVGDTSPGQTKGQGLNEFGALWYVLGTGGNAVTSASSSPAPAPASTSSSSSYGY